ncbi:hypothetical protein GPJ56_003681 [Histomonas meleagridis]|uniref:uncharacterized protein n=1 Tax=Histomonas meleagridis TaxID=135588 RepID=UPI003559C806|nr:hypothetical protein GPJ56_003681 [Histomonas meleagridis]KAH0806234.1 hypothetical protein GO595_000922 [Histomonas meleagridis]
MDPNQVVEDVKDTIRYTLQRQDPATQIHNKPVSLALKEVQGYLFSITFDKYIDFSTYELYSFIEQILKTGIEDVSVFRDFQHENKVGVVVIQLAEEITTSKLQSLQHQQFNGATIYVRLFSNENSFLKYLIKSANKKLSNISLPLQQATPPVFVQNFHGEEKDLYQFFARCGQITCIKVTHIGDLRFYIIFFGSTAAARIAYRTFNGFPTKNGELIVTPFFKRACERAFVVTDCTDIEELKDFISNIGVIDQIKLGRDGNIYVLMETIDASSNACILLNSRKIGLNHVSTHFIEYESFNKITV